MEDSSEIVEEENENITTEKSDQKNTENDEKSENPEIKGSYWQRRGIELKMRYKNGEISRLEYIKLSRADKKQRKANRREKLGVFQKIGH